MKKTFLFIVIASAIVVYSGCSQKKTLQHDGIETEIIDFFSFAQEESEFPPAALLKSKEYVKLDGSFEDVMFKQISEMQIFDDRIFILDDSKKVNRLIVFDRTGKGIGKVGQVGQGPEDYVRVHHFDVDNAGNIYFLDGTTDRLFVYDKNRKFISKKATPFEFNSFKCLPDNKLLCALASWNHGENEGRQVALTDTDMKTEQTYLQYDEFHDDNIWISNDILVRSGNKYLYNQHISDYVYEFSDKGELLKSYYFDFGKKNIPNEYKKDLATNWSKLEEYCCLTRFTVVNENYILGTLWSSKGIFDEMYGGKKVTKNFVIDRKSKKLYISKMFEGEKFYSDCNFAAYSNEQIVSFIYPGQYEDLQKTGFPEDVKKHLEDDNFVLCIYTLK